MSTSVPTVVLFTLLAAPPLVAGEWTVVPERSIVAIVTHKAGLASGLAHNHLIAASEYDARLEFDPAAPTATRFRLRAEAERLIVDEPETQRTLYPRLEALAILSEPFEEVSDGDRAKIRETMLGRKQLDAERFPEIEGSILAIVAADDPDFPYRATIALEVHGQRVERELRARFEEHDGEVELEAVGEFRFTEFGIKPYSAFLGTVKNRDDLHLYVRLGARPPHP